MFGFVYIGSKTIYSLRNYGFFGFFGFFVFFGFFGLWGARTAPGIHWLILPVLMHLGRAQKWKSCKELRRYIYRAGLAVFVVAFSKIHSCHDVVR